jgi:predicted transposase YdaD
MRLAPLYQQDREQAVQEGRIEGIQEGEAKLVLRLLQRRFGEINPPRAIAHSLTCFTKLG